MNLFHMDAQLEKKKENICQLRSTGSSRNSDTTFQRSQQAVISCMLTSHLWCKLLQSRLILQHKMGGNKRTNPTSNSASPFCPPKGHLTLFSH